MIIVDFLKNYPAFRKTLRPKPSPLSELAHLPQPESSKIGARSCCWRQVNSLILENRVIVSLKPRRQKWLKVKNLVFNQLIKGLPTAGGGQHIVNAPKSLKVPPPGRISETARDPDHQRPSGFVERTQRPPRHTTVQRKGGVYCLDPEIIPCYSTASTPKNNLIEA